MLKIRIGSAALIMSAVAHSAPGASGNAPIAHYADNPRDPLFRWGPTAFVASAERYGAVLKLDFNYSLYQGRE